MEAIFKELKTILSHYSVHLSTLHDKPGYYYLETNTKDGKGKPHFFGMVKQGPKKVSYHLMPVYCDPSLLDNVSADLRKRMQGKSCFNFTKSDSALFLELGSLTARCFESYKSDGKV